MKPIWRGRHTPLQMGLRACSPENWLDSPCLFGDEHRVQSQIALKSKLIKTHLSDIYVCPPEGAAAADELYKLIARATDKYSTLDKADSLASAEPLLSAGQAISDDLLLLAPDTDRQNWILKAGFLAFPSHWALHEKIGRPMSEIHAPVPGYAQKLEVAVNRFFNAMEADVISVRLNWTLQVGNTLFTPVSSSDEISDPDQIPDNLYLRAERQTFRKLPETGWVVFAIGTHIAPIGLWQTVPEMLVELREAVLALSPDMKAYRGMHRYETAFHKYVDSVVR